MEFSKDQSVTYTALDKLQYYIEKQNLNEFKDEIFDLSLEERKSILRGLQTLMSVKDTYKIEEQINYKKISGCFCYCRYKVIKVCFLEGLRSVVG